MLEWLLALDTRLFFFLNTRLHHPLLDRLMPLLTNKYTWYLPGLLLLVWLVWRGGRPGRIIAALMILGLILSDQISSSLLKPFFERPRPCKVLAGFRLLGHCGSIYGFPSSHAANAAVLATICGYFFRSWRWYFAAMAFFIGYSRIYVGVHYPLDVLAGFVLGALVALLLIRGYEFAVSRDFLK